MGLPINMREVWCAMARGGMASNLALIVPALTSAGTCILTLVNK
jgi:hypothetical protein